MTTSPRAWTVRSLEGRDLFTVTAATAEDARAEVLDRALGLRSPVLAAGEFTVESDDSGRTFHVQCRARHADYRAWDTVMTFSGHADGETRAREHASERYAQMGGSGLIYRVQEEGRTLAHFQ